ncbi:MAG TPA: flagellar motor switch protein FliM [Firmicutes bacterium]|nr:flagellar motor switch protein FliM [Bacillota bacterium]
MARDTLTQSEIDSLISAISSGKIEDKATPGQEEYQVYDFRRPTKFSKEQLKTMHIMHDNYSRIMGNFLTAFLRVPVKLEVVSVAQVTYEEFLYSLPIPTLMTIFNMSSDLGIAMLETNPAFVFTMIDLLFGGEGKPPGKIRELTEIELSVMKQIIERFLDNLRYVWKGIVPLSPQIESMDTNPQFNQVISSSETVALITISAQIKEVQGFINLCFPYITLDRTLQNLTAQHWFNQFQQAPERTKAGDIEKSLYLAEVETTVILGQATITLDDYFQLQEGDVLALGRQSGEPLEVLVENKTVFLAQPGLKGKHLAVQITGWINAKDDFYES